jgi:hypothetical protein
LAASSNGFILSVCRTILEYREFITDRTQESSLRTGLTMQC